MLLITTTHQPATDLGFLLHKNPARNYAGETTFGKVHVVFPEATEEKTTAALLLDIDPIALVRRKKEAYGSLDQFVNDRPYVASSFLSVAMIEAFSTAMNGRSKDRQELAETPIPLELRLPTLACKAGEERIKRLFEPLGYEVIATRIELDSQFPEWGESPYFDLTLRGTLLLKDALRHLYLLLPVLDAKKHYYMDANEVEKMISKGEGWLSSHPEKDLILRASLGRKPSLMREAMEQLANIEESLTLEANALDESNIAPEESDEPKPEKKGSLHSQRHKRITEIIREMKPKSVIDLGCGEGKLIRMLIPIKGIQRLVGMDVSYYDLEKASKKLRLEEAGVKMRERIQLLHGSLMYRDHRLEGFDVCTVVEVIEHLDPPRLAAFERVLFKYAMPKTILLTTPNREYNVLYEIEDLRHNDHRFEWTRQEFTDWANRVGETYGYSVTFEGLGDSDEVHGSPSQMAVFSR